LFVSDSVSISANLAVTGDITTAGNVVITGGGFIFNDLDIQGNLTVHRNSQVNGTFAAKDVVLLGSNASLSLFANTDSQMGVNNLNPQATLDVVGFQSNVFSVQSTQSTNRNIIAANNNQRGLVVESSNTTASLQWFVDSAITQFGPVDAFIEYDQPKQQLELFSGNNVWINSQTSIGNVAQHVHEERVVIYDMVSTQLYQNQQYSVPVHQGNALSLAGSAQTLMYVGTTGGILSGGVNPNDTTTSLSAWGWQQEDKFTTFQNIISGNSLVRSGRLGIQTIDPDIAYTMHVNGPSKITNARTVPIVDSSFEIKCCHFFGSKGMAVGTPSAISAPFTQQVFVTNDSGVHWTAVNINGGNLEDTANTFFAVFVFDSNYAFVAGNSGYFFFTADGGVTWKPVVGVFDTITGIYVIPSPSVSGVRVFVLSQNSMIYYFDATFVDLTTAGSQLTPSVSSLHDVLSFTEFRGITGAGSYIYVIGVNATQSVIARYNLSLSLPFYTFGALSESFRDIGFVTATDGVVVGADTILYTHNGGTTWSSAVLPTSGDNYLKVDVIDIHLALVVGENGKMLSSQDGFATWNAIPSSQLTASGNDFNLTDFNLIYVRAIDTENFVVISTITPFIPPTLGKSRILYLAWPQLFQNQLLLNVDGDASFNGNVDIHNMALAGNITVGSSRVNINSGASANQGGNVVTIGRNAGLLNQEQYAVAVGDSAGSIDQHAFGAAFGSLAGNNNQGSGSVAFGANAGRLNQGGGVAIGFDAAEINQGLNSVAVGPYAAQQTADIETVAVGFNAGNYQMGLRSVALGSGAGLTSMGQYAVAIGYQAGLTNQHNQSIVLNGNVLALNTTASGLFIRPVRAISLAGSYLMACDGSATHEVTQIPTLTVNSSGNLISTAAINTTDLVVTGNTSLNNTSLGNVTVGSLNISGNVLMQNATITQLQVTGNAVMQTANITGNLTVGKIFATANIYTPQLQVTGDTVLNNLVVTGNTTLTVSGVSLDNIVTNGNIFITNNLNINTGTTGQGIYDISLGIDAGKTGQQNYDVAIGFKAGETNQGLNAVAIGHLAGQTNQHANSVALNASGNTLSPTTVGFFVDPVRQAMTSNANQMLVYDSVVREVLQISTVSTNSQGNLVTTSNVVTPSLIADNINTTSDSGNTVIGNPSNSLNQIRLQNRTFVSQLDSLATSDTVLLYSNNTTGNLIVGNATNTNRVVFLQPFQSNIAAYMDSIQPISLTDTISLYTTSTTSNIAVGSATNTRIQLNAGNTITQRLQSKSVYIPQTGFETTQSNPGHYLANMTGNALTLLTNQSLNLYSSAYLDGTGTAVVTGGSILVGTGNIVINSGTTGCFINATNNQLTTVGNLNCANVTGVVANVTTLNVSSGILSTDMTCSGNVKTNSILPLDGTSTGSTVNMYSSFQGNVAIGNTTSSNVIIGNSCQIGSNLTVVGTSQLPTINTVSGNTVIGNSAITGNRIRLQNVTQVNQIESVVQSDTISLYANNTTSSFTVGNVANGNRIVAAQPIQTTSGLFTNSIQNVAQANTISLFANNTTNNFRIGNILNTGNLVIFDQYTASENYASSSGNRCGIRNASNVGLDVYWGGPGGGQLNFVSNCVGPTTTGISMMYMNLTQGINMNYPLTVAANQSVTGVLQVNNLNTVVGNTVIGNVSLTNNRITLNNRTLVDQIEPLQLSDSISLYSTTTTSSFTLGNSSNTNRIIMQQPFQVNGTIFANALNPRVASDDVYLYSSATSATFQIGNTGNGNKIVINQPAQTSTLYSSNIQNINTTDTITMFTALTNGTITIGSNNNANMYLNAVTTNVKKQTVDIISINNTSPSASGGNFISGSQGTNMSIFTVNGLRLYSAASISGGIISNTGGASIEMDYGGSGAELRIASGSTGLKLNNLNGYLTTTGAVTMNGLVTANNGISVNTITGTTVGSSISLYGNNTATSFQIGNAGNGSNRIYIQQPTVINYELLTQNIQPQIWGNDLFLFTTNTGGNINLGASTNSNLFLNPTTTNCNNLSTSGTVFVNTLTPTTPTSNINLFTNNTAPNFTIGNVSFNTTTILIAQPTTINYGLNCQNIQPLNLSADAQLFNGSTGGTIRIGAAANPNLYLNPVTTNCTNIVASGGITAAQLNTNSLQPTNSSIDFQIGSVLNGGNIVINQPTVIFQNNLFCQDIQPQFSANGTNLFTTSTGGTVSIGASANLNLNLNPITTNCANMNAQIYNHNYSSTIPTLTSSSIGYTYSYTVLAGLVNNTNVQYGTTWTIPAGIYIFSYLIGWNYGTNGLPLTATIAVGLSSTNGSNIASVTPGTRPFGAFGVYYWASSESKNISHSFTFSTASIGTTLYPYTQSSVSNCNTIGGYYQLTRIA
jgi:hypothetical protein